MPEHALVQPNPNRNRQKVESFPQIERYAREVANGYRRPFPTTWPEPVTVSFLSRTGRCSSPDLIVSHLLPGL